MNRLHARDRITVLRHLIPDATTAPIPVRLSRPEPKQSCPSTLVGFITGEGVVLASYEYHKGFAVEHFMVLIPTQSGEKYGIEKRHGLTLDGALGYVASRVRFMERKRIRAGFPQERMKGAFWNN